MLANSPHQNSIITIGVNHRLSLQDAYYLSHSVVKVSADTQAAMEQSYQFLKSQVDQRLPVYGVNTNFGDQVTFLDQNLKNQDQDIYYASISKRQEKIIRSLSTGVGTQVAPDIVRATMMLRAHCLSQGYSGVNPELVNAILAFINADITPVVYQYGSIGASGDLIPLSMIAAALIGENVEVTYQGKTMKAPAAMELAGIKKYTPHLRDGLALINGTSFMAAISSIALHDLKRLFPQMLAAIGMTLESMQVISSAYHPLVHQLKHNAGERLVNDYLTQFWKGSQLLMNLDELRLKNETNKRMQDYYSLRSVPQGFGPFYENLETATTWIENEMNSVNDNPIVDAQQGEIHHTANFMGFYVTDACDLLKMNIAQASTWLHALLANLIHPRKNHHLPANIVPDPGNNNGFRSMQLLAAALAVQNRKLGQAHQSYSLPTEGDNQDVNSLGTHAAFDLTESVANLERLTAILFLAATQALELRGIEKASDKANEIAKTIRQCSPALIECRPMSEEIVTIVNMMRENKLVSAIA